MKDMNILWYSWQDMCLDVNQLCRDIVLDNFKPDVIVGLSRGGLTPGVMMSHWMNKPFKPIKTSLRDFPEWEDYLPRKTDERVLILDDVCDQETAKAEMEDFWYQLKSGERKALPDEYKLQAFDSVIEGSPVFGHLRDREE